MIAAPTWQGPLVCARGSGPSARSRFDLRKAFPMKPTPIVFWVVWTLATLRVIVAGASGSIYWKAALGHNVKSCRLSSLSQLTSASSEN